MFIEGLQKKTYVENGDSPTNKEYVKEIATISIEAMLSLISEKPDKVSCSVIII